MKTVIATIKPCFLGAIRTGKKTIEVRKTTPEPPFRVLCCESSSGGKIKAEFICNNVFKFQKHCEPHDELPGSPCEYWIDWEDAGVWIEEGDQGLYKATMLSIADLDRYIGGKSVAYGWCISSMIDYCSTKGHRVRNISEFGLKRPPQSWQYLREEGRVLSE